MIHDAPRTGFSFGRLGAARASAALAFNPATAAVSAGVAVATDALNLWVSGIQHRNEQKTATTLVVNQLEEQLRNLRDAYLAEARPSCADQRAALDAYDAAWLWLQSPAGCGGTSYGAAGNRCITDRAPGGKFPWRSYYRDPIATDPRVSGCDTGNSVYLPSINSGTYQALDLTSTGGSATSGSSAAEIAAQALTRANTGAQQPEMSTAAPNYLLIAAAVLGAIVLVKSL